MQKSWSLYNHKEKLRIDDLRLDQVQTILLAIPTSQMKHWYACQEGDLHWQHLPEIAEFYEQSRHSKGIEEEVEHSKTSVVARPMAAKVDPRRPLFEDASEEMAKGSTLKMESLKTKERRSARRYIRNLMFRARLPDTTYFECLTHDVSMTGMSLKDTLPETLAKTFKGELTLKGVSLKVLCTRVSDHQLKIVEAEGWDVLRNWIINW